MHKIHWLIKPTNETKQMNDGLWFDLFHAAPKTSVQSNWSSIVNCTAKLTSLNYRIEPLCNIRSPHFQVLVSVSRSLGSVQRSSCWCWSRLGPYLAILQDTWKDKLIKHSRHFDFLCRFLLVSFIQRLNLNLYRFCWPRSQLNGRADDLNPFS